MNHNLGVLEFNLQPHKQYADCQLSTYSRLHDIYFTSCHVQSANTRVGNTKKKHAVPHACKYRTSHNWKFFPKTHVHVDSVYGVETALVFEDEPRNDVSHLRSRVTGQQRSN